MAQYQNDVNESRPGFADDHMARVPSVSSPDTITCRLCEGRAKLSFETTFLKHVPVALYRCENCESLQTNDPEWLAEAYADTRPVRDIWMVSRTERMKTLVVSVLRILRARNARLVDWGGGNGLLVRMLRDVGVDAYRSDLYVPNYYAVGFDVENKMKAAVMTAFEVFEHSDNPRKLMREMSEHDPDFILLSTKLYKDQGKDWGYLHPDSGKHVFFFSAKGLRQLGSQFGYQCVITGAYTLMHKRPIGKIRKALLKELLRRFAVHGRWLTLVDSVILYTRRGSNADFERLKTRGIL